MTSPRAQDTSSTRSLEGYAQAIRKGLITSALLLAVLPIPVTALHLLPTYRAHARFLTFYAPLVCLLLVAYLFYLRDTLARLMFADILRPPADDDLYQSSTVATAFGRATRRARSALLAILPAALVLTSFYCFNRYRSRLEDSVSLAVAMQPQFQANNEGSGLVSVSEPVHPVPNRGAGAALSRAPEQRAAPSARTAPPGQVPSQAPAKVKEAEPVSLRDHVLQTASIDAIPLFTELTALYIGIFAAALLSAVLMALKEYAQGALKLSEQDLVLGGWESSAEEGPRRTESR